MNMQDVKLNISFSAFYVDKLDKVTRPRTSKESYQDQSEKSNQDQSEQSYQDQSNKNEPGKEFEKIKLTLSS